MNHVQAAKVAAVSALLGALLTWGLLRFIAGGGGGGGGGGAGGGAIISSGKYGGYQWKTDQTLKARTVVETPFARAQIHTVKLESGKVVDDWLWFDERDAVNVLVRTGEDAHGKKSTKAARQEQDFLVFRQRKYGIRGETLAPIGGMVDETDATPLAAAKRELYEETGLVSDDWTAFGGYRVAANRGAGVLHAFFADAAYSAAAHSKQPPPGVRGGGQKWQGSTGDLESQTAVRLSRAELVDKLTAGEFKELKWSATIAMSLLHLNENHLHLHT